MFQGAIIVFCILIIFLAWAIMPWWFLPVTITYFIIVEMLKKH